MTRMRAFLLAVLLAAVAVGVWIFDLPHIGVGLFISALSRTQQHVILGAFVYMVPSILLSGFATLISSMPQWLQPMTLEQAASTSAANGDQPRL